MEPDVTTDTNTPTSSPVPVSTTIPVVDEIAALIDSKIEAANAKYVAPNLPSWLVPIEEGGLSLLELRLDELERRAFGEVKGF